MVRVGRGGLHFQVSHCVPPLPGSVVGPALTFRIRQNAQNFSLADVAGQTGELSSVSLVLFLSSPPSCGVPLPKDQEEGAPTIHPTAFG